jgi:hypothetical protein
MDEQIYMEQASKMDRPIPGQSLTNDPENPAPFEQAPQITNVHEGTQFIWDKITDDEAYEGLMTGLSQGVPVMPVVQVILFNEFQKGTFNPDLMMMLVEPTAYMIIALAERLDIDVEIDTEEDEGEVFGVSIKEEKLNKLREAAGPMKKVPEGMLTDEQLRDMQNLPELPSLLEPTVKKEEAPIEQPSLMAPTEGQ